MKVSFNKERHGFMVRLFSGWTEVAYIVFQLRGPCLTIEWPSDWHEHRRVWVGVGLVLVRICFSWPYKGEVVPDQGQCSGPEYGFQFFDDLLWVYHGKSTGRPLDGSRTTFTMPWGWRFQKHVVLTDPETHPYHYKLKSGQVQERTATIKAETRRWTRPWFPWSMTRKTIDVQFSDEVGERSGSWKGGTIGCGYEMNRGETPVETLRRMERERAF